MCEIFPSRARKREQMPRQILKIDLNREKTIDNHFECVWITNTCEWDKRKDVLSKTGIILSASRRTRKSYPNNVNYLRAKWILSIYPYRFDNLQSSNFVLLEIEVSFYHHTITWDMKKSNWKRWMNVLFSNSSTIILSIDQRVHFVKPNK